MSKFTNWTKKHLVDVSDESNSTPVSQTDDSDEVVSTTINFEDKLKFLMSAVEKKKAIGITPEESYKLSVLKRDLEIKNVKQRINKFDNIRQKNDNKFIPYNKALKNEVASIDANDLVDKELSILLEQKLDVYKEEDRPMTDKMRVELEKQEENNKKREAEHIERINAIKNRINQHDNAQKKTNKKYVTFEETCLEDSREENDNIELSLQCDDAGELTIDTSKNAPSANEDKYNQYIQEKEADAVAFANLRNKIINELDPIEPDIRTSGQKLFF